MSYTAYVQQGILMACLLCLHFDLPVWGSNEISSQVLVTVMSTADEDACKAIVAKLSMVSCSAAYKQLSCCIGVGVIDKGRGGKSPSCSVCTVPLY